ncbi:MAG: LPS export ABC transporter permease LptG [Candidatus Rariloculaceae bacterium]
MNVLDRYITAAILKSVAVVVLVLLAVVTFVEFVGQVDDVGTAQYEMQHALAYVALRIPRMIFQMLPAAALLGALLSLGNLAVHSELVVMRASGVSRIRMMGSVGIAGLVLLLVMALLGESLAPSLGAYARQVRSQALLDSVDIANAQSAWMKDGDRIFNFRRADDGINFGGVYLFELDAEGSLDRVASADSAEIDPQQRWILANYVATDFSADDISSTAERRSIQNYELSLELLGLSEVREDLLDTQGLKRYIEYLDQNDLDSDRYVTAYWARISDSVSVLLMTLLALPFVSGALRTSGTGGRLVVGLVIGLGYYIVAQTFVNSGEVFDLDPLVVAWLPSAILLVITSVALLRIR